MAPDIPSLLSAIDTPYIRLDAISKGVKKEVWASMNLRKCQ